jgi:hypothetical protein
VYLDAVARAEDDLAAVFDRLRVVLDRRQSELIQQLRQKAAADCRQMAMESEALARDSELAPPSLTFNEKLIEIEILRASLTDTTDSPAVGIVGPTNCHMRLFGEFNNTSGTVPWGLAIDQTGRLLVADPTGCRIQVFDTSGHQLRLIRVDFPPAYIVVDSTNRIYAAAHRTDYISVVSADASHVSRIPIKQTGYELLDLSGLALDSNGNVVIAVGCRVQVLTPEGRHIREINVRSQIRHLAVSPSGEIAVVAENGVQFFDSDGSHLRTIAFARMGDEWLCFDGAGKLVIASGVNRCVTIFAPDGSFLRSFGSGENVVEDCSLSKRGGPPWTAAVDRDGTIFLCDSQRIHVFTTY